MIDLFLKDYDTEVGIKTAQIVIYNQLPVEEVINYRFKAGYSSEGHNILSTSTYYVGKFEEYLKGIDQTVDQSYARRLYLNHGANNG
jgi:hypothetical protein